MTETHEDKARTVKAIQLIAAFRSLASSSKYEALTDAEVLPFVLEADDATWQRAESLAGVKPASGPTRAVVRSLLERAVPQPDDPFEGF